MTQQDREKIEAYIDVVTRVQSSRFFKRVDNIAFRLDYKTDKSLSQDITGFDEDELRSMLLDLRKITLKKEGLTILEICDLLLNSNQNTAMRNSIIKCKQSYNNLMCNPMIRIVINDEVETTQKIIDRWFYGHYFHEWENLKSSLRCLDIAQPIHKFNFITAITNLASIAGRVSENARQFINDSQT